MALYYSPVPDSCRPVEAHRRWVRPLVAAPLLFLLAVTAVPTVPMLALARPASTAAFDPLHLRPTRVPPPAFDPLHLLEDENEAPTPLHPAPETPPAPKSPSFDPLGLVAEDPPNSELLQVVNTAPRHLPRQDTEEMTVGQLLMAVLAVAALFRIVRGPQLGLAAASGNRGPPPAPTLVGEDAAVFDLAQERLGDWVKFLLVFVVVMGGLFAVWVYPPTGLGDDFIRLLEQATGGNTEVTMLLILTIFGIAHSGLAALRPKGEEAIGARAYRVVFGLVSLPLALLALVYFINHRYDGLPLWNVREVPGVHTFVWITTFISFIFLYPSTFNLLEVAAVAKPKLHMWETGIMRITRHPQMVGQLLWCLAHTIWIGNSFALVTSAGLMAHHLFGCWHGDRRLAAKYGPAFEEVKARTSVWPFVAILEGRQQLPEGYWREFARGPYLVIVVGTVAAYYAHPLMQLGSYQLPW